MHSKPAISVNMGYMVASGSNHMIQGKRAYKASRCTAYTNCIETYYIKSSMWSGLLKGMNESYFNTSEYIAIGSNIHSYFWVFFSEHNHLQTSLF